ncbi:MAG: alkaline phosphatase family protein [Mycobacteriaceae bacterium]
MTPGISRRSALAGAGLAVSGTFLTATSKANAGVVPTASANSERDIYVLVVDGMRPDELGTALTPHLSELASSGINYLNANAIMVAETLPNHTAMMTGVHPYRSGVPANSIYDPELGKVRDLDMASDLLAATLLDRLRTELGLVTASVLSKRYLHGLFGGRACIEWAPNPLVPGTGHAPDNFTIDALIDTVDKHAPNLIFANLGDIDRVGHLDLSGPSWRLARNASLMNSDYQISRFTQFLQNTNRWERSVIFVLADHSMDWSIPTQVVTMHNTLDSDPLLSGRCVIAQNGGSELIYFTGDEADRQAAISRIIEIYNDATGIEKAEPITESMLGQRAGDVVAYCQQGWRFSDPGTLSNPIPGNHGHSTTLPIPFFVTGGHPAIEGGQEVLSSVHTIDIAPTIAQLFGLTAPAGGWDGVAQVTGLTNLI